MTEDPTTADRKAGDDDQLLTIEIGYVKLVSRRGWRVTGKGDRRLALTNY